MPLPALGATFPFLIIRPFDGTCSPTPLYQGLWFPDCDELMRVLNQEPWQSQPRMPGISHFGADAFWFVDETHDPSWKEWDRTPGQGSPWYQENWEEERAYAEDWDACMLVDQGVDIRDGATRAGNQIFFGDGDEIRIPDCCGDRYVVRFVSPIIFAGVRYKLVRLRLHGHHWLGTTHRPRSCIVDVCSGEFISSRLDATFTTRTGDCVCFPETAFQLDWDGVDSWDYTGANTCANPSISLICQGGAPCTDFRLRLTGPLATVQNVAPVPCEALAPDNSLAFPFNAASMASAGFCTPGGGTATVTIRESAS